MKRLVIQIIVMLSIKIFVFADDGYIGAVSGNAGALQADKNYTYHIIEGETEIAMEYEHVILNMYDDHYSVEADFVFYNNGEEKTVFMGFPESKGYQAREYKKLENFKTYIDGNEVQYICRPDSGVYEIGGLNWYVKKVNFKKNQFHLSRVTYNTGYGFANAGLYCGHEGSLAYTYGTGGSWYGPIGKIIIDIVNNTSDIYITGLEFCREQYDSSQQVKNFRISWQGQNILRLEADNVNPESTGEELSIDTQDCTELHSYEGIDKMDDVNTTTFLQRKVEAGDTSFDLSLLTKKQLRIIRNDCYAVNGRIFAADDLKYYYESIPSYIKKQSYDENQLTDKQKALIEKVKEEESLRK
jgi:hypothetical protein